MGEEVERERKGGYFGERRERFFFFSFHFAV